MPVFSSALDHIVIVAATLEQGADYCERMLGVRPLKGGEHAQMGTHNYLLNLGAGVYLEVIVINPAAPHPEGARWFGMDEAAQQTRIGKSPYPATFVARTTDIATGAAALPALGSVRSMQRDTLQWKITIPDDGALIENGTVPTLIEWPEGIHPVQNMPDSGCRLICLEAHHPQPERLAATWARIGLHGTDKLIIRQAAPNTNSRLLAHIATPDGVRILSGNENQEFA